MQIENYDMVVLGVGGMGSAVLYTLAKRGFRVCGIEQFGVAHDRGSSHGQTRIIRKAYFEHPHYLPLLNRSYQLWKVLESASGQRLQVRTGLMLAGKPGSKTIKGLERCYAEDAQPHERLSRQKAGNRFPQFRLADGMVVFYDPLAGFLYVEKCVEQHVRLAIAFGATLHTNEAVVSWQAANDRVLVRTAKRQIIGEKLVITAGAWAVRELAVLGLDFEIWRKVVFWYDSPHISQYALHRFPVFYVETEYGHFYGFPAIDELGLKVAEHMRPNPIRDPSQVNRALEAGDEPPVLRFLGETFTNFLPAPKRFSVCMYTRTADGNFILDVHPQHENVIIAAGFSGHGFKFAPVVGEILGDLAVQGGTSHPIDFLRIQRLMK